MPVRFSHSFKVTFWSGILRRVKIWSRHRLCVKHSSMQIIEYGTKVGVGVSLCPTLGYELAEVIEAHEVPFAVCKFELICVGIRIVTTHKASCPPIAWEEHF